LGETNLGVHFVANFDTKIFCIKNLYIYIGQFFNTI